MPSSLIPCSTIRGLAELFFRVWQGRRMHHRSGRRRQVARFCLPHVRRPSFGQRSNDPGTFPRRKGRPCYPSLVYASPRLIILDTEIDPKRAAIPREEHLRNMRYFVGGLAPHTTADSMRVFFSRFGKVVDATVMVDRETGRSKGFGFVTFEDNSNDGQLVGKLGLILDDKQVRCLCYYRCLYLILRLDFLALRSK